MIIYLQLYKSFGITNVRDKMFINADFLLVRNNMGMDLNHFFKNAFLIPKKSSSSRIPFLMIF